MKTHLLLPVTIMVSVALVGVMKIRGKERDKVERRSRFEGIKLRVTHDVLDEYESDVKDTQTLLAKAETDFKALDGEVNMLWDKDNQKRGEVDTCQAVQKTVRDALASAETEFSNVQADSTKEKDGWSAELATLKQQLETRSSVCDFIKPGVDTDKRRKLCGEVIVEAPKPEEPKAEAPEPVEPKAEAPKQEEPKAEAPKPEEPKAEAPKPEEPKAEAPKPEEPKAEAPKAEAEQR